MEIWFNPACSKCRIAREALESAEVAYTVRRYLDQPPTAGELAATLEALGLQPWEITRMNEPLAKQLGLDELGRDRASWLRVLVEHPVLIQRPILVTKDGSAWVARDADSVEAAIAHEHSG